MMRKLLTICLALMMLFPAAYAATKTEPPVLPEGTLYAEEVDFKTGQTFPVYSAPSGKSVRGAKGKARVSTNDWIQVFGRDGDWILVQYAITEEHYRIGYITAKSLPKGTEVEELSFTASPAVLNYDTDVTDDPLFSQSVLASLPENTKVTCLATLGSWTYIEYADSEQYFRGFIPTDSISRTVYSIEEANYVLAGNWKLYAGSVFGAMEMTFQSDGSMTGTALSSYGETEQWEGTWNIERYDTARKRYWNDPEFELVITRGNAVELFGLRICKQYKEDGTTSYALVLSDGDDSSGMVLCE